MELGAGEGWELGAVGVDVGVDLGLGGRAAVGEGLEPGARGYLPWVRRPRGGRGVGMRDRGRGRVRGRGRGGAGAGVGRGGGDGRGLVVERRGEGERRVRRQRAEREDGLRFRHSLRLR